MKEYPNILSISGEGQNVGKTLLSTQIIAKYYRNHDIIALKITPHNHSNTGQAKPIVSWDKSTLLKETNLKSTKDTGRMLAAGALHAYLLQAVDKDIRRAIENFIEYIGEDKLIICESGSIAKNIKPGISFFIRQLSCQVSNIKTQLQNIVCDRVVNFDGTGFDLNLNAIQIINQSWNLKED